MKTRNAYLKIIKRLELFSQIFLIAGIFFVLMMGFGLIGMLGIVALYIIMLMATYRIMALCRCEHCGCIEVFVRQTSFIRGFATHCPSCHAKIVTDQPIDHLKQKAQKKSS